MSQDLPDYVTAWWGKRVAWYDHPRHLKGRVIEVAMGYIDHEKVIWLKVARDDGFLSVGVEASNVTEAD